MNPRTCAQLRALNQRFYEAHAEAFDQSRGDRPWPGWQRILPLLPLEAIDPTGRPGRRRLGPVLDIGCGNARFACFLDRAGIDCRYTGVDASPALLAAAHRQLPEALARQGSELVLQDFLAGERPGEALPEGPFDLIVLMGILHHVPGSAGRLDLLRAASARLAPTGLLVAAAWQFDGDPREQRKRVAWETLGPVLGETLDPSDLEAGDWLLRFGEDPAAPPRYCHCVADGELASWPGALGMAAVDDYRADGARGDANHYLCLRHPGATDRRNGRG